MACSQNLASFIPALLLAAVSLSPFFLLMESSMKIWSPFALKPPIHRSARKSSIMIPKLAQPTSLNSLISINHEMQAKIQKAYKLSQQKIYRNNAALVASKKLAQNCAQGIKLNSLPLFLRHSDQICFPFYGTQIRFASPCLYFPTLNANHPFWLVNQQFHVIFFYLIWVILLCFLRIPNVSSKEAMAFSTYSSQLLALFLIHLVVHPALGDPATQQRIDRICRQMEDYGFCNRTFNEILRGPTDYVGLTLIANDQALRNATNTYQFVVQLLASTTDPPTRAALENCRIGYGVVKQAFVQANFYFNRRDYANMVQVERAAPRAEAYCRPPTPQSQLVERKRELRILVAMAVVAGHILAPATF